MTETSGGTSPGMEPGGAGEGATTSSGTTYGTGAGTSPGTSGATGPYNIHDMEGETSGGAPGESGRQPAPEWLGQLQSMIDNVATQAAPILRQVAAKAAELAAVAGEKAGPIAHRAADATEAAGSKLAERGREVAAELRRGEAGTPGETGEYGGEGAAAGDRPNVIEPGPGGSSDPRNPRPGMSDAPDTLGE